MIRGATSQWWRWRGFLNDGYLPTHILSKSRFICHGFFGVPFYEAGCRHCESWLIYVVTDKTMVEVLGSRKLVHLAVQQLACTSIEERFPCCMFQTLRYGFVDIFLGLLMIFFEGVEDLHSCICRQLDFLSLFPTVLQVANGSNNVSCREPFHYDWTHYMNWFPVLGLLRRYCHYGIRLLIDITRLDPTVRRGYLAISRKKEGLLLTVPQLRLIHAFTVSCDCPLVP